MNIPHRSREGRIRTVARFVPAIQETIGGTKQQPIVINLETRCNKQFELLEVTKTCKYATKTHSACITTI